jgi:hypothetical protein
MVARDRIDLAVTRGRRAVVQLAEVRKRRSFQVAADLCRGFTDPELAKGINLLKSLPDGISLKDLRSLDGNYEEAAQVVAMTFETMGILVYKDMASFQIVQELAGGLLRMTWRKIEYTIKETREEQGNLRYGEWVQWLAERLEECESDIKPAFEAYADWTKHTDR